MFNLLHMALRNSRITFFFIFRAFVVEKATRFPNEWQKWVETPNECHGEVN